MKYSNLKINVTKKGVVVVVMKCNSKEISIVLRCSHLCWRSRRFHDKLLEYEAYCVTHEARCSAVICRFQQLWLRISILARGRVFFISDLFGTWPVLKELENENTDLQSHRHAQFGTLRWVVEKVRSKKVKLSLSSVKFEM